MPHISGPIAVSSPGAVAEALRLHGEGELVGGVVQLYLQCSRWAAHRGSGVISRSDTLLLLADFVTFYSLHCETAWPPVSGAVDEATAQLQASMAAQERAAAAAVAAAGEREKRAAVTCSRAASWVIYKLVKTKTKTGLS